MKKLLAILVLGLLTININCGGGGSGGTSTSAAGRTTVTINLGETRTASHAGGGLLSASSTIPSSVVSIRFVISAPDMATIERVISVAGKTVITESFDIPNGANRDFLVEAMDASGNVLYRGEIFANLDGSPVTLIIVMVSTDVTPPVFSGISSIDSITTTSMTLSWSAATDNVTPQGNIQYLIYMSTTFGGENFAMPSFTTTPGATSFSVTGLSPVTTYYFVVRAMDEAGNIDTNTVEKSAKTLAPPDVTPPTFAGLVSATAVSPIQINLQWNPASDDQTPAAGIVYLVYMATTSGGENLSTPTYTTFAGDTSFSVLGLSPGTTYYFIVRAKDAAGNMDSNTVEKSATTLSLFTDLSPINPVIGPSDVSCGVINNGTVDAVNVEVWVEYTDGCFDYCDFSTISVPAGGTQPVIMSTGFAPTGYRIIVDPNNTIPESNESNNCISNNPPNHPNWCSSPLPASCSGV